MRFKLYIANPSLWHDECALGLNVKLKSYAELFGPLDFLQIAPPFFLVLTKFLLTVTNASKSIIACDFVIRLIPFVFGLISIPAFYLLCKEVLQTRLSVLAAFALFALNMTLINYSCEFKSYSADVFFAILIVLFFTKIDITKMKLKNILLASLGLSLCPWFSLPSVFIIAGGFIGLLIKKIPFKKFFLLALPIFIVGLIYLKVFLLSEYNPNISEMTSYWENCFISPDFSNFGFLFIENVKYFFNPLNQVLPLLVLLAYGIFTFFKSENRNFLNIILSTFFILVFASILHIYPFSTRLVLFLCPFLIILIAKPIEKIGLGNIIRTSFIILMLLIVLFSQIKGAYDFLGLKNIDKGEFPREMMIELAQTIKPNDIIFVNGNSVIEFEYYKHYFDIKNKIIEDNKLEAGETDYYSILNNLPKGSHYCFYMPFDSPNSPVFKYIYKWLGKNASDVRLQNGIFYLYVK